MTSRVARAAAFAVMGGALVFFVAVAIVAQDRLQDVIDRSPYDLVASLALKPQSAPAPASAKSLATALSAAPLNATVVNAAIYAEAAKSGKAVISPDRLELLRRMGWRSTPALQNRVYMALTTGDYGGGADIVDALLRRGQHTEQAIAVFNLYEAEPTVQPLLIRKLAAPSRWRSEYFSTVEQLVTAPQAAARGDLVLALQRMGVSLGRNEVRPTVSLLVRHGLAKSAYGVWRNYRRTKSLPLNDPDFDWAYEMRGGEIGDAPFEWYFPNGDGYWTEIDREGGDAVVRIHWDGRGAPDFLMQRTYLIPGRYRLSVRGADLPATLLEQYAFTAACKDVTVVFNRVLFRSADRTIVAGDRDIPCDSPYFMVSGRPERATETDGVGLPSTAEKSIGLTELRLQLAPAG